MILLRFSRGVGLSAAIVQWGTWSPFAHVGFKLPDGSVLDATPDYGVLQHRVSDDDSTEYWEPLYPQHDVEKAVAWAMTQRGREYDWSGVLGFTWRFGKPSKRDWRSQKAWFCSELVAEAFNVAKIPLLHDNGCFNRITPRDLLLSTMLRKHRRVHKMSVPLHPRGM